MNAPATMASLADERSLLVQRNDFVHLRDPQGWQIECISGCAWITQEGDPHDTLLATGQCHVARRPARLLLQALEHCALQIRPAPGRVQTRLVSRA